MGSTIEESAFIDNADFYNQGDNLFQFFTFLSHCHPPKWPTSISIFYNGSYVIYFFGKN